MIKFPTHVYKCPGAVSSRLDGVKITYDYVGASNQQELDTLLSRDWHVSIAQAHSVSINKNGKAEQQIEPNYYKARNINIDEENRRPKKFELKQRAEELGIVFEGKPSYDEIKESIEKALSK